MSWLRLFQRDLSRRDIIVVFTVLIVVVGGGSGLWHLFAHLPGTWKARWQVNRYLKKHGVSGDFRADFRFPSQAEMGRRTEDPGMMTEGSRTGKDFETLRREYMKGKTELISLGRTNAPKSKLAAKREELAPVTKDLWEFQWAWAAIGYEREDLAEARRELVGRITEKIDGAHSYAEIYTLIGQELWVARRLLESAHYEHRRTGLTLALQAAEHAFERALNPWLAADICRGYLWPHFADAEPDNRRSPYYRGRLIAECVQIFRTADQDEDVIGTYEILYETAESTGAEDWARAMLGREHEQVGNWKAALRYLKEIEGTNQFRWALRRVPIIEKRLD